MFILEAKQVLVNHTCLVILYDKLTRLDKNVFANCLAGIACTHLPTRCHANTTVGQIYLVIGHE